MFQQLMETAPEVLQALGLRPESLQQEIAKMQNMDKLKVLLLFILGNSMRHSRTSNKQRTKDKPLNKEHTLMSQTFTF